ncbi:MAG: DUF4142 domain-containing protein [Chitinophagaceae bacterium]|nr:MAG: DUF4142 domain-containing protein [Chitinophagaceae bacterium]
MKTKLLMAFLAISVMSGCDKDDDDDQNNISTNDRDFTMKANMANHAEVDAGQLAATKGMEAGVRDFGAHMVADHTTAKLELKDIATSLGVYAPDSLDAEHVQLKAQLMLLSGRAFDSVYIHSQVKDHQKAIALFEAQAGSGENRRLIDYANKQLPHLRMHLHTADSLAAEY